MRFAIIYSKNDIAGKNIVAEFNKISFSPQIPIIEYSKEILDFKLDYKKYPELKKVEFIVFASKHKSIKGDKSLSVHAPGNWRSADFGGEFGKISKTSAFVLKFLFKELRQIYETSENKDFKITLECTHHGPSLDFPCCFIELGSNEEGWKNLNGARILASTICKLQNFDLKSISWIPCFGIGGPHYCPNFNKLQLNSNYAVGHVIPEYSLPLTETMLKEAEQKTLEQIQEVIVDWKGCGNSENRNKVIDLLKRYDLKYKRI